MSSPSLPSSGNSAALASKDSNASLGTIAQALDSSGKDVKSMEYHRQVLQSKIEQGEKYISPSDDIMSPCTAKLNAYRNKQVGKAKPKSLFAQNSVRKLESGNNMFRDVGAPSMSKNDQYSSR